jgi:hypothetical protein
MRQMIFTKIQNPDSNIAGQKNQMINPSNQTLKG